MFVAFLLLISFLCWSNILSISAHICICMQCRQMLNDDPEEAVRKVIEVWVPEWAAEK